MEKYAQQMSLDVANLAFSFDGDDILATDTPLKLDMEDDDVLDVVHWIDSSL